MDLELTRRSYLLQGLVMMNSNIFLVNLPPHVTKNLLPVLEGEHLGNVHSVISDDINQPLNTSFTNSDYVIFYIEKIDEEHITKLVLKEDIPTLLITGNCNFEMERTAKEHYINMVVNETNSELTSLIYGALCCSELSEWLLGTLCRSELSKKSCLGQVAVGQMG